MPGARARNLASILSLRATQADVGKTVSHISLWSALTGGDFLMGFPIHRESFPPDFVPVALVLEAQYRIPRSDLNLVQTAITDPNGMYHETFYMAERSMRGRLVGGFFIQFHDGAPGSVGTSNVIVGIGRVGVTADQLQVFRFASGDGSIPDHVDSVNNDPIGPDPGHDDHSDGPTHNDDFGEGAG